MKNITIISPPFACGVARLINILLELNIKTSNLSHSNRHWVDDENGMSHVTQEAFEHLRWFLPVFHKQLSFYFPEKIEIFWEHRLSPAQSNSPAILFVRDPRDAIYSLYRRIKPDVDFSTYLKMPDVWPHHFPGLFGAPPGDTYAFFCFFWLIMSEFNKLLIVRFEDLDEMPHVVIQDVLKFIGVYRDHDSIGSAIAGSSFKMALNARHRSESAIGQQYLSVHSAKVYEWKGTYNDEQKYLIGMMADYFIEKFGYEACRDTMHFDMVAKDVFLDEFFKNQLYELILSKLTGNDTDCHSDSCRFEMMHTATDWAITVFDGNIEHIDKILRSAQIFFALLCADFDHRSH